MPVKNVLLGVTGSIAAYKAVEVASTLTQRGYEVRVIMTAAATKFVAPLTFESITHHPVLTDLWSERQDTDISHIRLAHSAALLAIAPATAHAIASLALGLADDALMATALATRAPMVVCPAMNTDMWQAEATRANVATIRARGVHIVGPISGNLAEGISGEGRMADPAAIVGHLEAILARSADFAGRHLVVTAGPTYEPIDPVRFIGNRSSGKMGYAIAAAAAARGAHVTLVTGPSSLEPPGNVELVRVATAQDMFMAVQQAIRPASVLIMAAAVADYTPLSTLPTKLKRSGEDVTLSLAPTVDILASIERPAGLKVVAFAAETNDLMAYALKKLAAKRADLLVANDVSEPGSGFESDMNHVWLCRQDAAPVEVPLTSKRRVADYILDAVATLKRDFQST